jgi:hypothetical protein
MYICQAQNDFYRYPFIKMYSYKTARQPLGRLSRNEKGNYAYLALLALIRD